MKTIVGFDSIAPGYGALQTLRAVRCWLPRNALPLVLGILSVFLLFTGCGKEQGAAGGEQLYTCGMHPQVIQNKPGNCPICGMKLTPIRKQPGEKATATASPTSEPRQRKIKYYKSTMNAAEVSSKPAKDSMGMEMVPVYEEETESSSVITI